PSCAVFTRRNPFPPNPPLPRSHYRPSLTQKLTKQQKKTVREGRAVIHLSAARPPSPPPATADSAIHEVQPSLAGHCPLSEDLYPDFCESWPSTDLGSPPAASPRTDESSKSQESPAAEDQEDSVLARYIERFRRGRPQSRMERQRSDTLNEGGSFWWLSSSPPEVTVDQGITRVSPVEESHQSPPASPDRALQELSSLSDLHYDAGDEEILQLQERASRLLQSSEHSISSSSIPVSSEGLASNLSSPVSAEELVQQPTVSGFMDLPTAGPVNPAVLAPGPLYRSSTKYLSAPCTRPEDDILFQWRLRRKMEQARQWSLQQTQGPAPYHPQGEHGLFSSDPAQTHHFSRVSREPTVPQAVPASTAAPSPLATKLVQDANVLPHMHLLCDVLPCPVRQLQLPIRRKSPRKPAQNQSQTREDSSDTSSEAVPSKDESSPLPVSTDTTEEEWLRDRKSVRDRKETSLENKQKCRVLSNSKTKLSREGDRTEGQHRLPQGGRRVRKDHKGNEMLPSQPRESSSQERRSGRSPKSQSTGRTGDQAPPPSPIHNALGQVVSEVLFPVTDSPARPMSPGSSGSSRSPRSTPPAPPQSPAPASSLPQHTEVITQLLQEAEDSDGLEFEDDPLLQVLRQQREWVKEQIR
ncbi:proline and serine-rich protein 3 isoform X1, partial [Arapaima gigas]